MNRTAVVTPNVDLSKVEAINQKRTLAFINHWMLHTVGFLNQFSAVCEERLISLDTKLRRADQSLAILEAKLNSVPDLEGVVAPTLESTQPSATTEGTASTEAEISQSQPPPATIPAPPEASNPEDPTNKVEEEAASAPEPAATPVSKDPRFVAYFKMLAVGVPLPAVKLKMTSEGLDPSILDDPNAPAPALGDDHTDLHEDSDSSSVSSFSD